MSRWLRATSEMSVREPSRGTASMSMDTRLPPVKSIIGLAFATSRL
jgi:hypothetical protein